MKRRISLLLAIILLTSNFTSMAMAEKMVGDTAQIEKVEASENIETIEADQPIEELDEPVKENEDGLEDLEKIEDQKTEELEELEVETRSNKGDLIYQEGYLGPDSTYARWTLDGEGNLVFFQGQMGETDNRSWEAYADEVKTIRVGEDGNLITPKDMSYYFSRMINLEKIDFINIDTSNTENMSHLFSVGEGDIYKRKLKKLDLSKFDTRNVVDMSYMFHGRNNKYYCFIEEIDISSFDTSKVRDMSGMFSGLSKLKSLDTSHFETQNVVDMSHMFEGTYTIKSLDLSNFQTENVIDMGSMFRDMEGLTSLDISSFKTDLVQDMSHMFSGTYNLINLDINHFDTSEVRDMSYMFSRSGRKNNLDLSNFDTSKVRNMSTMFGQLSPQGKFDISGFNTEEVEDMSRMFSSFKAQDNELDLRNFNTENVTDMSGMFSSASEIKKLDISSFNTGKVTDMNNMFKFMRDLEKLDVSHFDTGRVTNMNAMFHMVNKVEVLDVSRFDTRNVEDMGSMFGATFKVKELDVSGFDTSKVTTMDAMFSSMDSIEKLDVTGFDTSKVTNMRMMFDNNYNLKELDVTGFDTSKVTNMRYMFSLLSKLKELDISNFDTSSLEDGSHIFWGYSPEKLILGEKTIFKARAKEGTSLTSITKDNKYTGGWIREDDENRYDSSKDFLENYDGSHPGAYVREKVSYSVYFKDGNKDIARANTRPSTGRLVQKDVPAMTKEGYIFTGWIEVDENGEPVKDKNGNPIVDEDGNLKKFDPVKTIIDEDKRLMATWTERKETSPLNIVFDGNGGTFSNSKATRSIKIEIASTVASDEETPTREGYRFLGWTDTRNGEEYFDFDTKLYNDISLYARWEKSVDEKVRVTLDGNGGSFSDNSREKSVELVKGESLTRPEDPSRSGYSFEGWRLDGETSNFDFSKSIDEDMVLKAAWKADGTRPPINPPVDPEPPVIPPIEPPVTPPVTPDIDDEDGKLNKTDHLAYINGYKDNTVRPEANITREEVSAVFFRLLTKEFRDEIYSEEVLFTDVGQERWSLKEIASLNNGGIVEGYPDGSFRPGKNITRAEIATMAARFEDIEADGEKRFTDIEGHWAEDYINAAASKGWVQGNKGSFRPDDKMTRAEFVTMVNNMLERNTELENMLEGRKTFKDLDKSKWYYGAMEEAANSHEYEKRIR